MLGRQPDIIDLLFRFFDADEIYTLAPNDVLFSGWELSVVDKIVDDVFAKKPQNSIAMTFFRYSIKL